MKKLSIPLALLVGALASAGEPRGKAGEAAADLKALQGSWYLLRGEVDGRKLSEGEVKVGRMAYKGDRYTVRRSTGDAVTGTAKLDPTKKPRAIDITDADGPYKGKVLRGIYAIKGDELTECFAAPGRPRPTKFTAEAGSGHILHVWKRVRE